jgi:hypothetical protein
MTLDTRDLGLGKIRKVLDDLKETTVTFGYQGPSGEAHHPGTENASVAQVAAWQEFGTSKAPARPLGRVTMERAKGAFESATSKAIADVIDGRATTAEDAATALGVLAVQELRKTIDTSREWAEENRPSTIQRKGHDQPLVGEFGKLYEAASYAIRRNGEIVKQGDGT